MMLVSDDGWNAVGVVEGYTVGEGAVGIVVGIDGANGIVRVQYPNISDEANRGIILFCVSFFLQ